MTTRALRRLWRRKLTPEAIAASDRNERIALNALRLLLAHYGGL